MAGTDRNLAPSPGRLSRRSWMLQAGSLGAVGLGLDTLLQADEAKPPAAKPPRARSCILFFMEGGPAHQDLWDLKPEAPLEVRGEFRPIPTTVPGLQVCEHLPLLARQMHCVALVRSVEHRVVDHNAGAYQALTGKTPFHQGRLIVRDEPDNFPPYGAIVARLRPSQSVVPSFMHVPDIMSNNGHDLPGQRAGFLGAAYDPLTVGDPSVAGYTVSGLELPRDVTLDRLNARRQLRDAIDHHARRNLVEASIDDFDVHYRRAYELIASPQAQAAFDIDAEPASVRERYGLPDRDNRSRGAREFGGMPHLGQCMLLARRLVESGVRLVTVCSGRRYDQAWDTHRQHFPLLKRSLLPYADRAFAALLADLAERGLLDETLVVAMGEFGRTPKLGQITSGAGADAAGRDHWPYCYTVALAGAGIQGGAIYGSSDRHAAYPKDSPVTPEDISATIYHALGIPPETQIRDPLDRPHALSAGRPILDLFG